jgi:glycosyltransferase involved in cell wall biosynthesis
MKICLTIPAFTPHGGIRIIMEWANRLSVWHDVILFTHRPSPCNWFRLLPKVRVSSNERDIDSCDMLIITSPHFIHFQNRMRPVKKIIFQQMMEHLFRPHDEEWNNKCKAFYLSPYPMITISEWNKEKLINDYGRSGPIHIVGNGVNHDHFPLVTTPKRDKIVLVEGWEASNTSKDVDYIGAKVASRLRNDGFRIVAYGGIPIKHFAKVPHEYFHQPTLQVMNRLYDRAMIMIKASRFDNRSCAPMEAMTKGTVTARAIVKGDDDLIDCKNARVVGYDEFQLYAAASELLNDETFRKGLAKGCYAHLRKYSWDYWMEKINAIITGY